MEEIIITTENLVILLKIVGREKLLDKRKDLNTGIRQMNKMNRI